MRSLRFVLPALLAAAMLPVACDLSKTADQLSADRVMIGTLLSTPPVEVRPSFLNPDGGFFDGGATVNDGGGFGVDGGVGFTVPGQTVAFVFFGAKTSQSLDSPPEPIDSAEVSLRPAGGTVVQLENDGSGNYSKSSSDDESFTYESGKTYDFIAVHEGQEYVGRVEDAPPLEQIAEFHPDDGFVSHPANTAFTFTRPPAPTDRERDLGFVTVFPISSDGEKGEPTFTNIPNEPLEFLELIALPANYKTDTVTLPASAFPEADSTYLVVFQAMKTGGPESNNLFSGSALLAGSADVGIFRTP